MSNTNSWMPTRSVKGMQGRLVGRARLSDLIVCVESSHAWVVNYPEQILHEPYDPPEREYTGLILGLRPANERWRYFVTTSLIGWPQA